MGKKKKFIDKKTAHHFYVMHRSQQDPLYYKSESEGGSKLILHPANERTAIALNAIGALDDGGENPDDAKHALAGQMEHFQQAVPRKQANKVLVDEMGFPLDGYDYSQHLATVDGTGTIISKSGKIIQPGAEAQTKGKQVTFLEDVNEKQGAKSNQKGLSIPSEVLASGAENEYDREKQLDSITLREDTMDEDIAFFLDERNDIDTEENPDMLMDDDFMDQLIAAEKAAPEEGDGGFDLDAHVAALLAQAEEEEEDEDYGAVHFQPTSSSENRPRRDIDDHFDAVFDAQYGEEEIGDLEEYTMENTIEGEMEPDSELVTEVLDDHINKVESEKAKKYEMSFKTTVDAVNRLTMQDEDDTLLDDPDAIAKHFGYENKPKPKFDCETIVSTYSTLDNHPSRITGASTLSKKQQAKLEKQKLRAERRREEMQAMENLDEEPEGSAGEPFEPVVIDTSIGRPKQESKEEKKMRKKMLKEQRRIRRMEKKATTTVFKEERNAQLQQAAKIRASATAPPGVSTFRL
eukprot:CAMPEP_0184018580 /NCGR_PEP_ID=MMETSP0954-20121128/8228_1 /TAXON_ID=627963 /ORGANISM="Aplanochytrium sp, Strain PBS07" /LENGTH=519 /DNA_ID=CAMNT_0026300057 /DNA_START=14 /DNA_END=1573 /DNA_ORIENTATION=-